MTDFEHALVKALNQCRRDGVKAVARNVKTRLDGGFAFYAEVTIRLRLHQMHQRGLIERTSPRGSYITPSRHVDFCPECGYDLRKIISLQFAS